jgi:hypothetical protein
MDLQEFLSKAAELDISIYEKGATPHRLFESVYSKKGQKRIVTADHLLMKEWVTGGRTGSSCYGRSDEAVEARSEPNFDDLDTLIEAICPDIKFMQYKKILPLITEKDRSDGGDYYGNYYHYTIHIIRLGNLYEKLVELGLL